MLASAGVREELRGAAVDRGVGLERMVVGLGISIERSARLTSGEL